MKPSIKEQIQSLADSIAPDPLGKQRIIQKVAQAPEKTIRLRWGFLAAGVACASLLLGVAIVVRALQPTGLTDPATAGVRATCERRLTSDPAEYASDQPGPTERASEGVHSVLTEGSASVTRNGGVTAALAWNSTDAVLCVRNYGALSKYNETVDLFDRGVPIGQTESSDLVLRHYSLNGRHFYLLAGNTTGLKDEPVGERRSVKFLATHVEGAAIARTGNYWLILAELKVPISRTNPPDGLSFARLKRDRGDTKTVPVRPGQYE